MIRAIGASTDPSAGTSPLDALRARWAERLETFRLAHALVDADALVTAMLAELEAAIAADADAPLTLEQVHELTGLSVDHIGRKIRRGELPNAGRKHAPRVRRADVAKLARAGEEPDASAGSGVQADRSTEPAPLPLAGARVDGARRRPYDQVLDGRSLLRSRDGGTS